MTNAEFNRWLDDLQLRFPSVESWQSRIIKDDARKLAQFETWRDVLGTTPVNDALEVNRLMQAGELPWVGSYDGEIEKLPQHIRRLARSLAAERTTPQHAPDYQRPTRDTDFPAGKLLRRIIELEKLGTPHAEALNQAFQDFPVGAPKYQPRFNCHICLDTGYVTVAHPAAIQAMLLGEFAKCHHREAAMRCSCKGHLPARPRSPICVYDPAQDFRVVDFMWSDAEVARFEEWVYAKRDAFWNDRREPAFDTWNRQQREFAP